MSLLDLLYLERSHSDPVCAAVRKWCAMHGCQVSDDLGQKATAIAVSLAKSSDAGGADLLAALSEKMAEAVQPQSVPAILVVEDEPFIALDMEDTLTDAGFSVEARSSCADASTWLAAKTPAVAILDLHLKDGEGTSIAAALRKRGVPVVFCSGTHPRDLPEGYESVSWVQKPFLEGELIHAVVQALEMQAFEHQREKRA